MHVIHARNAHCALPELMYRLQQQGVIRNSRNGPVIRLPGPCTIQYDRPQERVIFHPERAANPFFHLLESLWMLAGRNDLAYVANIMPSMKNYSDDGVTFNGAYGYRWQHHFKKNQLFLIAAALRDNPDDRRQVLAMWDPFVDLGVTSKDLPCNTHAYFSRDSNGRLDMMVCNRSNDAIWGALGSNVVHFSILQEIMARLIGCPIGSYWQVSNNMHLYLDKHETLMNQLADRAFPSTTTDPYEAKYTNVTPLLSLCGDAEQFLRNMEMFLDEGVVLGTIDPFIRKVAGPMSRAADILRHDEVPEKYDEALDEICTMPDNCDWRMAAEQWVEQKKQAWENKKNG